MNIKSVTEKDFKAQIEEVDKPVIADFYASWCAPCKKLSAVMKELAEKYGSSVNFIKINIETEKTLSEEYNVISIPTLITFKNGQISDRITGFESREAVEEYIQKALA